MKITDTHIYFWGSHFSNFFPIEFNYKGYTFPTTEHAFMWEKARFFNDSEIAELILKAEHPNGAKALGRKIKNYDNNQWNEVRFDVMYKVNRSKWQTLKDILIKTGNKIIVEASPMDKIWGVGLSENDPLILDEKNWKGQNLLGKVLMKIRDDFKY